MVQASGKLVFHYLSLPAESRRAGGAAIILYATPRSCAWASYSRVEETNPAALHNIGANSRSQVLDKDTVTTTAMLWLCL